MATMSPIRLTAYEWHGGGSSPLYSFASCGGLVHDEEHRQRLYVEIEGCMKWCEKNPDTDETKGLPLLKDLLEHVKAAKIGVPIEDPKDYYA
jgi:hypothetical protein